ncbi:MAG: PAS domain S-box protein [Chlorogloeopsis fritschii C42_A2020_084]|uniref:PAS domain S-box protein n=1 Tax=Chlorogloeopsis fritschii TaxID=1124 RepID=UPI0019E03DCD|nr:PAS domain S-box protein [Chlorogloeopsis fritschii]MBF2008219.1 PAS domain S-box protein [Chlorogloeopsis fritschii C42_A2020_084]
MKTLVNNHHEVKRIEVLRQYQILDSLPEQAFDDLAFLAAQICHTPIALINLIDVNRQWFKAKVGLDVAEMPIEIGFCPLCLEQGDVLVIPDTLADQRFATSPVVQSEPHVRFYAGVPLLAPEGIAIGTVCIADRVPREITSEQVEALKAISRLVIRQLELRRNLTELIEIKTEYQQAQAALQQSECTLRSFFDSTPMMMGVVELQDNDILHISDNATSAKFFGKTPEVMRNRLESEIGMPRQQVCEWLKYYREAERTKSSVSFEYAHHTPQGEKWLKATVSSIAACCNCVKQFAYVVEDITERKQAEDNLRAAEALLRSMTGVSPLAFYVVDNRTDEILYFNDRFCEIWRIQHLKEQMVCGKLKNQDIIPDCLKLVVDIPTFADACQPLQNENNRSVVEDEILFTDGRIIRRFSTQVRDASDRYFGRLYIFEDITARKQAEQQVREQAALLDITSDAIIVRDLSNKILLWNKSAENLYGWSSQEAIGKYANELLYNEPSPLLQEIHQTVLEHGSWQGELPKTQKSGKQIIVESRWTLVRNERLQPKSILVVDTDITQKKLLEKQFLRNQRMESIGTLASGIAHDLNNVLSPILMSVQLLQANSREERDRQILSIVETNVKRGANLVKQVLSFARGIEGDRTILQVKHLILEMKQIIEQTFPKSITLETEIQPELWNVCGDATQLHQVLINLCLNARDAMPGGGTLKISARNIFIDENYARVHLDAKVGYYIVLSVADTGVGIPNELLDRIFEPFFTTKELGKGTGLGLSTVMGIIKGHGGFITVSSQPGKGTKFKVYLSAIQTDTIPLPEDLEVPKGNGQYILVVDDESAVREITATSLEEHNYKALVACDGIEAVALYAQYKDKIRGAIIDMMMPNMDGTTTINTLQKMNPLLPIVAVSGLASSEQIPQLKTSKRFAFLAKPYTAQELLKTLHSVIS